jgi:hypothetical protein
VDGGGVVELKLGDWSSFHDVFQRTNKFHVNIGSRFPLARESCSVVSWPTRAVGSNA